MRIGLNTVFAHRSPEEWAAVLKGLNCRSVMFPVNYKSDVKTIDAYVKAAKENDLVIAEVGAWSSPLANDRQKQAEAMEKCVEQLKLADYIGAKCCVNVAGASGERWDGYQPENFTPAFYEKTVLTIQKIIDSVNPKNTFYCIEPMPWMVPIGPEEYLQLIKDVDRKAFGVHMDIANWMCGCDRYFRQREFMDKVFLQLGDKIKSCHLKDTHMKQEYTFQIQEVPCGEGELDLEYYAELVNRIDPELPMLIEHLKSEEAYRNSLTYVKERLKKYR